MNIRCGNRDHTDPATQHADLLDVNHYHHSVAQVKLCFSRPGQPLQSIQETLWESIQLEIENEG